MNNEILTLVVSFRFRGNVVVITRIVKGIVTVVKLFFGLLMPKTKRFYLQRFSNRVPLPRITVGTTTNYRKFFTGLTQN